MPLSTRFFGTLNNSLVCIEWLDALSRAASPTKYSLWKMTWESSSFRSSMQDEARSVGRNGSEELVWTLGGPQREDPIGPSHSINRDVPWEDILAFYEAIAEFGSYARLGGEQR
jgi:hypothetical protein